MAILLSEGFTAVDIYVSRHLFDDSILPIATPNEDVPAIQLESGQLKGSRKERKKKRAQSKGVQVVRR